MHRHSTADSRHSAFVTRHSSLVIAFAALLAANASATNYTWSGAGEDGCWTNPANWLVNGSAPVAGYPGVAANGTPTTMDIVSFRAGDTADITLDHAVTLYQLVANQTDVDITLRGGASGTNAPLTISNTFNVNASGGRFALDNFGIVSTPGITLGASRALSLDNASFLRIGGSALAANSSVSLDGGSAMLVAGSLSPVANGNNAFSISGASSLEITGGITLTAGNTLSLSGASTMSVVGNFNGHLADSLSLAGGSTLSANEVSILGQGKTIVIDDSTLEARSHCYLGATAPGGGTVAFRGAGPRLVVRGTNFRYSNNNAAMAQPIIFNYVVPEGGFTTPPLQHLANSGLQSFRGYDNVKVTAKFTVDAASPALAAGTTTTTPLFFSQPGIAHITKPYADISDTTATLAFTAADGSASPATDIATKMIVATVGSGPDADPAEVTVSAVSPVLPVAIAHKTLTASAAVTALSTTADATVLRLYVGRAADGSDAEVVAVEDVSAVGIYDLSWTAPAGAFEQTYYLFAEIADLDGEGLDITSSTSATTTAKTVDAATYTWIGGASGNWGDPANWSDNQGGNCIGYPDSTGAAATFPSTTAATVVFDGSYKLKDLYINGNDYNLVFTTNSISGGESALSAVNLYATGNGGTVVFDGVAFSTSGGVVPGVNRTVVFRGGGNTYLGGNVELRERACVVVEGGATFSLNNLYVQDFADTDGFIVVDDATMTVRGGVYAPYSAKAAILRFQGGHPLMRFTANGAQFRARNVAGGVVEFLVPAGGYAECPIQGTGAMSTKLGNDGANPGYAPIAFRVLPESPAFFADATLTQSLVSWETAGINTAMVTTSCASEAAAFSWGEGTYPTTLSVTIAGSSHADRLVVTGAPSEVPATGVAYGAIDGLNENDARTFTAPSGTFDLSATRRATCAGWRLYAVDPATGARTLEQASTALTCNYVHDGSLHELEWQWREEFLVAPTAGAGGSVSASAWAENGKATTITATPDAGYVFREWTGVPADGLEFAASRPFTATGAATPSATFDEAIYASPNGSASGDGSRANPYTLAAAVSAAAGRTGVAVVLLSGDYPLSATFVVSSAVRITSETGDPADVTITSDVDNKGVPLTISPIIKLTHAGARLSNVTVSGGTPSGANCGNLRVENATVFNCVIEGAVKKATKATAGGATYLKNGRITRSRIGPNTFGEAIDGGGVFMEGADALLEYCMVTNNFSNGYTTIAGGGVYATGGRISHCAVIGNATRAPLGHGGPGGGVRANGPVVVEWCLIAGNNSGEQGGGGLMTSSTTGLVVDHCTIVGNNAATFSTGGISWGGSLSVMRNCIVWGNTVSIPLDYARNQFNDNSSNYNLVSGNCFPIAYGSDVLIADPLFVDAAAGDYRLLPGSPCIALGYGCYDYDAETLQVGFPDFDDDTFPANEPLSFTAAATGGAGGYSFRWRVDDLLAGTQGQWGASTACGLYEPTLAPGHYRLTVEVTDAFGATAAFSRELYAGIVGTVYVVPAGTAGNAPEPPYNTLATAANDATEAIHYCAPGATLLFAAGDHPIPAELYVPRAVRVVSEEGPAATSLYRDGPFCSGESFRVVHLRDRGAVLSGFTVSNGFYASAVHRLGTGILNEGGMVTNCDVTLNMTPCYGQYEPPPFANLNGVVADCKIHDNYGAGAYGGSLYQYGAASYTHDVEIYRHTSTNAALRIGLGYSYGHATGGSIRGGLAERLYVHDNFNAYGSNGGNGSGVDVGDAELRNCLIVRNKTGGNGGGGVRVVAGGAKIVNCTITDNAAGQNLTTGKGGGLLCTGNHAFTMVNTVLCGNTVTASPPGTGDPDWSGVNVALCTIRNCAFSSAANALGENAVVTDNPRFADRENGDYTPGIGSSLRDNGAAWNWTSADTDIAGNPRVAGSAVDIGALEAEVDDSISCNVEVSGYDDVGDPVLVSIEPVGANLDGFEARVTVYGADGEVAETSGWGGSLLRAFNLEPGSYTVFVEVRNGAGAEGEANGGAVPIVVSPAVVYVVPEAARLGDPVFPYTSWETAATNLVDATVAAGNGTRVVVTNGTHVIAAPAVFGKASEIVSVEGPERTEIVRAGAYGQGDRFSMVTLGDAGASLAGFTVRNGFGKEGSYGALVQNMGGVVSNCVFTQAMTGTYYGGAVYNGNGLVTHCVFTNLTNVVGDGGLYYQYGNESRGEWLSLGGNRFVDNYYTYGACNVNGGVLRNCTITNNVMARRGNGGYAGGVILTRGRLENCLIANNGASTGGGGVRVWGLNCEIVNCTIVSNECHGTDSSSQWAGGIAVLPGTSVSLLNTIVWANRDNSTMAAGHDYGDIAVFGNGACTATTSIIGDRDPKFRRFRSDTAAYDFRLKSKSPAVDTGTTWAGCADALDLDGRLRVFGKAIDLGCFECERKPGMTLELR